MYLVRSVSKTNKYVRCLVLHLLGATFCDRDKTDRHWQTMSVTEVDYITETLLYAICLLSTSHV